MSRGTKHRSIRVEDALWDPAKAKADKEGVNLSEVIREALRAYVNDTQGDIVAHDSGVV
jgi:hypothetical protein